MARIECSECGEMIDVTGKIDETSPRMWMKIGGCQNHTVGKTYGRRDVS